MRYDLNNKTVVITGASSGIGRELATRLVTKYNCTVYAVARRATLLDEISKEAGDHFIPTPFDASIREEWTRLAKRLDSEGVVVDMLINCAGVLPKLASVENSTPDELLSTMEINFLSQVYATDAFLPSIEKSTQGAIISFSSSSALCPFGGVSAYCASKSASRAYFECLARENKKIYVASVMNGFVKTDIMKSQGASEHDVAVFSKISADLKKTVNKIIKKIKRRKGRIIVGLDAHLMNFLYKLFPRLGPAIITRVLKKSGLEIFDKI